MPKVVPFKRRRGKWPSPYLWHHGRRRRFIPLPRLPPGSTGVPSALGLVLLAGMAGAGYLSLSRPSSNPAATSHPIVAGDFELCSWHRRDSCVIDGDTIRYGGVKIRLADINAPETSKPKCAAEAALGAKAADRLVQLMNTGPFELVGINRDEDIYGRKLRIVRRDGESLGDTLIAEGLARRWVGRRRSWCG